MPVTLSGLSSDIDTQGIIQKLVEVERMPIKRLQYEKEIKHVEKKTWGELKTKLKKFDETLKNLYGFQQVFKKRKFITDKEEYINASVIDNADKCEHDIEINQLAKAHKIMTDKISDDKVLPGAIFIIQIGEEKVEIKGFKNGGKINKLVKVLKDEGKDIIKVQKVKTDSKNIILSIESLKTGEKNYIKIEGASPDDNKLFNELGLFRTEKPVALDFNFNDKTPSSLQFHNGYNNTPALFVCPGKKADIMINKKINNGSIEVIYKSIPLPVKHVNGNQVIQKSIDEVTIKDVTIFGADIILNKFKKPIDTKKGEAYIQINFDNNDNNKKITINLSATNKWTVIKKELNNSVNINSISFINKTDRNFLFDNLKIFEMGDGKQFKNVVQTPQDAKIKINGVEMTRDKNKNLDDIIDGVSLNLLKKSTEPIKIEIKEDIEKIEKTLGDFIKQYNNIIKYILEVSKNSKAKKPGKKKLDRGVLSNNITLMNLHSKIRATVLNSYTTSLGRKLAILTQIGISTGKWGSAWDNVRKGLLKLDKDKFIFTLNSYGDKISELFGYDSNNDKIIDTGIAFTLNNVITPFIRRQGIIEGKISLVDTLIRSTDKRIARKEEQLKKYEENLRHKFSKMEQGMHSLKGSQKAIESQMNNLPGFSSPSKKKK